MIVWEVYIFTCILLLYRSLRVFWNPLILAAFTQFVLYLKIQENTKLQHFDSTFDVPSILGRVLRQKLNMAMVPSDL